jgi:hypothetical protein
MIAMIRPDLKRPESASGPGRHCWAQTSLKWIPGCSSVISASLKRNARRLVFYLKDVISMTPDALKKRG